MSISNLESEIEPVLAAIRASQARTPDAAEPQAPAPLSGAVPFVTISRQTGAGGWSLAQKLIERISHDFPHKPWTAFDKDKVERLSSDDKTHATLNDSIEEAAHTWLDQLFQGLPSTTRQPKGEAAFHRVATTIRALAQAGRVIIVGRGGVYLTRGMTGGVHVRLVAPQAFRVQEFARRFQVPESAAAQAVREIDQRRESFYRRHFPKEALGPESFTLTLNSAALSEDAMVAAILAAVPLRVPAR
jgi:hypothetical protein